MLESNESPSAIRDEQSSHRSTQRHTRTRGGCERCRAQRRKCDEGKPRCSRCAGANAMCKYVTRVFFKDKNSHTLPNHIGIRQIGSLKPLDEYPAFVPDDSPSQIRPSELLPNALGQKNLDNQDFSARVPQSLSSIDLNEGWPLVGRSPLSSSEVELLKYFNHHVAPWLDVYDPSHTFGRDVTKLAMTSPCVLEVLLQVSAVFSGLPAGSVARRGAGVFHLRVMSKPPGTESPFSALRMIACFVLARTMLFIEASPDKWESSFKGNGAFHYFRRFDFPNKTHRQMWLSFLTLILRLVWAPELAHQIQTQLRANEASPDESREILEASLQCLKLLVDVMNFSFPASEMRDGVASSAASGLSRFGKWKELADELYVWYMSRPSDLEPLIEIENCQDGFPTVVFTGGAGISSNIIYHTAMLLLVHNKPPSLFFGEEEKNLGTGPPQAPLSWHVYRICGIAINSEPDYTNCWDPAMIAAFSIAARRITHHSQQQKILDCFDRIKISGWHIDSLTARLRDEWRPVE
ncbi:hypothetical protein NUW58_g1875 [Xylaria curta]|uniref:Uncharacterized protein n=1 Tax=Xylaria curta TaxID=42375 RepID=A0ACC1PL38_9PEZI|nr:hypothetical protein NUW58_g1875 [Xylaria curta]